MERKWYQQTWLIIVLLVFFFPVGLYLMWRYASWTPQVKWGVSGALALLVIIVAVGSALDSGTDDTGGDAEKVVVEPTGGASSPTPEPDPTKVPTEVDIFSVLEVLDVSVSGTVITISGRTDLPTGATVSVGFNVAGRADSDVYIGVDETTTVSDGEFSVSLDIPQRDEFVTGPYEVSVLFTPRGQSDSVLALVGNDGEKLGGELSSEASIGGFNTMSLAQQMDLELSVLPPSYVFQEVSEFPQGSPERALAEYAAAWRDQDWQRMVRYVQKTWLDGDSDPEGTLEAWYDFKALMGFEIVQIDQISEVTRDITFVVHYEAFTNQVEKKEITARVIRESAPYEPSPQGDWGVNPISALREDDLD